MVWLESPLPSVLIGVLVIGLLLDQTRLIVRLSHMLIVMVEVEVVVVLYAVFQSVPRK